MSDFPHSLIEFQSRFPDEAACVRYLFAARWPEGFVCPACGVGKAWPLQTKAWTWECARCGRQTSVTAGTIMHHSKLPLTLWFWAAYLMATHSADRGATRYRGHDRIRLKTRVRLAASAPDRSDIARRDWRRLRWPA